jgi:hypothetical protein
MDIVPALVHRRFGAAGGLAAGLLHFGGEGLQVLDSQSQVAAQSGVIANSLGDGFVEPQNVLLFGVESLPDGFALAAVVAGQAADVVQLVGGNDQLDRVVGLSAIPDME